MIINVGDRRYIDSKKILQVYPDPDSGGVFINLHFGDEAHLTTLEARKFLEVYDRLREEDERDLEDNLDWLRREKEKASDN